MLKRIIMLAVLSAMSLGTVAAAQAADCCCDCQTSGKCPCTTCPKK